MEDRELSVRIVKAVTEWQQVRESLKALRQKRVATLCEVAEQEPSSHVDQLVPCWKDWQDGVEDRTLAPESEWCDGCRQRAAVHRDVRALSKRHGALMRSILSLAKSHRGKQ